MKAVKGLCTALDRRVSADEGMDHTTPHSGEGRKTKCVPLFLLCSASFSSKRLT